jgi:hypothetical protein
MGRERFLFVPSPLPCGSALWDPDLTGRKSWRYSPECVEEEFCELRLYGVLRSSRKAPGQRAGWWPTRSNFLPQATLLSSYGRVATRIPLS